MQSDGKHIHFNLKDDDRAFVQCAVDIEYIFQRGLKDGIRDQNSRALLLLYQKNEAIALDPSSQSSPLPTRAGKVK